MNDKFLNRLDMFTRCLAVLDLPAHRGLWEGQPPLIFTAKVGEARVLTGGLRDAQQRQEANPSGAAVDKDREETELEVAADLLGDALVLYHGDRGNVAAAAGVDLTPTAWRELRDQQLLAKSQLVIDLAQALATGPDAALAALAAPYGITPAAVAALTKERKDYADLLNAPDVAIALRAALTRGFRPAFALVEAKFVQLDRLIGQFGKTPAGAGLVAAWKAARIVKDAGHGPGKPEPTPAG